MRDRPQCLLKQLQHLLKCSVRSDHYETYKAIQEWLTRQSWEIVVIIDKEVADVKSLLPPVTWTSNRKRPDIQICTSSTSSLHKHHILVQVEVQSGSDKESTIRKLILGLVDQLRWLRNRTSISKCSGQGIQSLFSSEGQMLVDLPASSSTMTTALRQE